jgi:Fic-DOC domain mobile mystery protein B
MRGPDGDGSTPLDPDEADGLLPGHIETRRELNEWEQANIARAEAWLRTRTMDGRILDLQFLKALHKRMFDETWAWAGTFRQTEKSIGIAPERIQEALYDLLANTRLQVDRKTMPPDEIALRFHHALVAIHPFPNGNGRHARLMTDALLVGTGRPRFTWGSGLPDSRESARAGYLAALRAADRGDFSLLDIFVRS